MPPALIITAAACLFAAYFAACHNALKAMSRRRLADLLEQRNQADRLDALVAETPALLLATGIARACCALVLVLASLRIVELRGVTEPLPRYTLGFVIAVTLMCVFTVAVPVYWAMYQRERLLVRSIPLLHALRITLTPVTAALQLFDPVVRRISGSDLHDEDDDLAEHVLDAVEKHDEEDAVNHAQREMIEGIVELSETTAGEIMTPRTEVHGIEADLPLDQVKAAVIDAGHSRIPVYRENLDHIQGFLYAKDLIRYLNDGRNFNLADVTREPFLVPETKPVRDLLAEFRQRKVHIAIVLDEYGGTAGLVTIEDILEEIVGEIHDEYEQQTDDPSVDLAPDGSSAKADARLHIDQLNDALGINLPEDEDYETVGGYVFSILGHIPAPGETFESHNIRVTVDEAEKTKVLSVTVEKLDAPVATETQK